MNSFVKKHLFSFCLVLSSFVIFGQNERLEHKTIQKGQIYLYWGWNNGWFTNSNITFSGTDYEFTLDKVIAVDRQSPFSINKYFNPVYATIPQYNVRIGYLFKNHWDISIGTDHMKYVVVQDQTVNINGSIMNSATEYDGTYEDEQITIADNFLKFEHTDGLNYPNIELRRHDNLFSFGRVDIHSILGFGVGLLFPKTNATLLNRNRYDAFHLSGYGFGFVGGVKITFFDRFFLQTEIKEGFVNMPSIRTTNDLNDGASQKFFFTQVNFLFGTHFSISKKNNIEFNAR